MADLRLFYACPLPEAIMPTLKELQEHVRQTGIRGRFTDRAGWHLTLLFLGATSEELLPELLQAGAEVSKNRRPGPMRVVRLTAFPSPRRPRVVVAELDDPANRMAQIRTALQTRLQVLDARSFRPHITLLRVTDPDPVVLPVVRVIPAFAPDRLILYQSTLTPGGARYDTLGAWTFPVTVNETPDA